MFVQYEVWASPSDLIITTASLKEAKQVRDENPGSYICYEDPDTGEIIEVDEGL